MSTEKKTKEDRGILLEVAALENGTAIDHIPPEQLFKVTQLLELQKEKSRITIGNNLLSKKMGRKGIVKVADRFFSEDEISRIALVAPNAVLNIIRNYEVAEKKKVDLPGEIVDIVKCNNPKCISNNEPMASHFSVIDRESVTIKCRYCERKINKEDIIIK
ncbi:MAG: aspartate carbamoyltransferase regulatory subunit [Tannerella sp.]|jgi:aspartate carbamoyltransferase regulatory subunit|nr:aspartate carbamoyltransferase regulatory subunit [Tannerella sp.]